MLYCNKITVFNFDESSSIFLSTLLSNVECQFSLGINRLNEFNVSNDRCLVMIKFEELNGEKIANNEKKFKEGKEWDALTIKTGYFTFKTDKDFFSIGDFSSAVVSSFEDFKNIYTTRSFLINEYKEYSSVVPHWELYGG